MANGFEKSYNRTYWVNNTPPAINEVNLNNLENGVNTLDNRVVTLDKTKLDQSTANTMVKDVSFNETTGIFTITKLNGSTLTIDTKLEKIAVNFTYDSTKQQIILTLIDGTKQYIDLSALITQYEFLDSNTITFTIGTDGKITANIKNGSVVDEMLEPNYLANITVQAGKAQASANASAQSASDSNYDAKLAQSYAIGGSGIREGEATDNAKYYKEQSNSNASSASTSAASAQNSAASAESSATTATTKAAQAATSATNAANSATTATNKASTASTSASQAATSASNAAASASTAGTKASEASASAAQSKSYAVGETDSAKYYYEQAKSISEGITGTLKPMGTVTFVNLPSLESTGIGWMYNISDEFVTTSDFKEGAGKTMPVGSNVFKTADGYWDVLAGSPVTGIKGSAETSFRRGNVNVTAANIGLGNVNNTADKDKPVSTAQKAAIDAKADNNNAYLLKSSFTSVPANADLNTYVIPGVYYQSNTNTAKTIVNRPYTDAPHEFKLIVENFFNNSPRYLMQRLFRWNSREMYIRESTNSGTSWSAWEKIAMDSDCDDKYLIKTGDTMTGQLKAYGGIALNTSTPRFNGEPQFLLGVDPFKEGGTVKWQDIAQINVNSATKATQDANGNNIHTTYVKVINSAGAHNGIFQGKSLGSTFTSAQSVAITAGTFEDLYIGDYWTIGGVKYRIAGFDIFLNTGDIALTKHHAVIVPDTNLYNGVMNDTITTSTGYYGSTMKQTGLAQALNAAKNAFGSTHVLNRRVMLCNVAANNVPTGAAWYDSQIDLMTERQVFGSPAYGTQNQNGVNANIQYSRFPLFSLAPEFITNRAWYWLQDVVNGGNFVTIDSTGIAGNFRASGSGGVRPYFLIS